MTRALDGTSARLAAYAGVLSIVLGAAFAVGAAVDPIRDRAGAQPGRGEMAGGHQEEPSDREDTHGGHDEGAEAANLPGLSVSEGGYTLVPARSTLAAGADTPFRFHITGPDGRPLRDYTETHEKDLHLIVVRRDLSGFQHVHPKRAADGTWSIPLDVPAAGVYRVFADFQPAGLPDGLTLGTDVSVAGTYTPARLPAPAASTHVDGYDVTMRGATPAAGETTLSFTVTRDGREVRDLQPYLGAFGHLVSLRSGDLAYLHTHPAQQARRGQRGGPAVRFATEFPTEGTYRLFLDFKVDGVVRTAGFTVTAGGHGNDEEAHS